MVSCLAPGGRFTLVYGLSVYSLLGTDAEYNFLTDWSVALAIDHAKEWKNVLVAAVQSACLLLLMDRLNLVKPHNGLEARRAPPPGWRAAAGPASTATRMKKAFLFRRCSSDGARRGRITTQRAAARSAPAALTRAQQQHDARSINVRCARVHAAARQ